MTIIFNNFLRNQCSGLIPKSNHTSSLVCVNLSVVIDGNTYKVDQETLDSVHDGLPIGVISKFFQNGLPSQIRLSNGEKIRYGFISFENIPNLLHTGRELFLEKQVELWFELSRFHENYIDIQFAKRSDSNVPNFGLGCFKYSYLFIRFRWMIFFSHEYRIPVIWKMFIRFLREIGYFDIFKINRFRSFVLPMFLRMISCVNKKSVRRNLLLSFIKKFLSDNCWFMIIGGKYREILGRPSKRLIELFSHPLFTPIVNFVNYEFDCVGLIKTPHLECKLVSISTTQVSDVGPLKVINDEDDDDEEDDDDNSPKLSLNRQILNKLHKQLGLGLCNSSGLLKTVRVRGVDMTHFPLGIVPVCGGSFCLFIFKTEKYLNFFIRSSSDGEFKIFCPYFFIMLHMFTNNHISMNQLTDQLKCFSSIDTSILVEALVRECGFEKIFNGSATPEEARIFLFESDFGRLLQFIIYEFKSFPERLFEHYSNESHLLSSSLFRRKDVEDPETKLRIKIMCHSHIECLQKNLYVSHLRLIFKMILERLQGRPDLGQENQETLASLNQLVKFLTVPPVLE